MCRSVRPAADPRRVGLTILAMGCAAAFAPTAARANTPGFLAALRIEAVNAAETLRVERRELWLAVQVNGVPHEDEIQAWTLGPDPLAPGREQLAISRRNWVALRLRTPRTLPITIDGEAFFRLDEDAGLSWRIDPATQTLLIDAPSTAFAGQRLAPDETVQATVRPSGRGGWGNYDMQFQRSRNRAAGSTSNVASGLVELGSFASFGSGSTTALVRDQDGKSKLTRLDTGWSLDLPERMESLRFGDTIGMASSFGRQVRFGGVQWGTNFATRPGFLSFPLPSMAGTATLPSTVDVFINNTQRYQGQVGAGPFDLTNVPIVTGQGQVKMVVRDLLGREQVVSSPYYVSSALLKPGLHAFSVEAGVTREDYGVASDHYGKPLVTGTDRLGVTDRFTREYRAELQPDQQTVGASGSWLLPWGGTTSTSLAASHRKPQGDGLPAVGAMLITGIERQASGWSGSLQWREATRGFTQLGQPAKLSATRSVSASLGTQWAGLSWGGSMALQSGGVLPMQRVATLHVGRSLGRAGQVDVLAVNTSGTRPSTSVGLMWSIALDDRTGASVSVTRGETGAPTRIASQVQHNAAPGDSSLAWLLNVDHGGTDRQAAEATWNGTVATLRGGVGRSGDQQEVRLGASGGVAWVGDSLHAARRIDGSFASVKVGEYANVRVLQDNHVVATTDQHGRAFISGLRANESNRIGVEASDLPFGALVDGLEVKLTPAARSGFVVDIPVQHALAASFRLLRADGTPVPAGSLLTLAGHPRGFPVGLDGKAFVSGLSSTNDVIASWGGQQCRASIALDTKAEEDDVPELGTLVCR